MGINPDQNWIHDDNDFELLLLVLSTLEVHLAEKVGIQSSRPRIVQHQIFRSNCPASTPEAYYRITLTQVFLDHSFQQLQSRFPPDAYVCFKGFSIVPLVCWQLHQPGKLRFKSFVITRWARVPPKNAGPPVFTFFLAKELGDWVLIESFVHYRKESFYGNLLTRPFHWSSTLHQIWILSIKSFILVPNMAGFLAMVFTGTISYQIMFVLRLSHTNNF